MNTTSHFKEYNLHNMLYKMIDKSVKKITYWCINIRNHDNE